MGDYVLRMMSSNTDGRLAQLEELVQELLNRVKSLEDANKPNPWADSVVTWKGGS